MTQLGHTLQALIQRILARPDTPATPATLLRRYLEGYLFEKALARKAMRDITPKSDQDDGGLESAGNVVCLPGVTLASIRNNGDDPGPSAA